MLERYFYREAGTSPPGSYAEPPSSSGFANTVSDLSPTAWWRLGEASGTDAIDSRGVADGSYINSPTLGVTGYATSGDTAVTFTAASSEYVSVPSDAAWNFGTSDFSLHFAINLSAWPTGANDAPIARGNGYGAGDWKVHLAYQVANRFLLIFGGTSFTLDAGTTIAGGWHAIGISCDRSGNAEMFVDGATADTADISALSTTNMSGNRALGIAAEVDPTIQRYIDGSLDEVIVWNGTLIGSSDWAAMHAARST